VPAKWLARSVVLSAMQWTGISSVKVPGFSVSYSQVCVHGLGGSHLVEEREDRIDLVTDQSTFGELGIESIASLEMAAYVEDRLGRQFPDDELEKRLQEFPGIGPAGAAIFCREVQGVWPGVAPYADKRVLDGAGKLGLPTSAQRLSDLVSAGDLPRLMAACVRASLDNTFSFWTTEDSLLRALTHVDFLLVTKVSRPHPFSSYIDRNLRAILVAEKT
jgi:acyl carrier protein